MTVLLVGALAFVLPSCKPVPPDCDIDWIGPSGGDWSDPANWDQARAPIATDLACSPAGSLVVVTGPAVARRVLLSGAASVGASASLTLDSAGETSKIQNLDLDGTITGAGMVVSGSATLDGATFSQSVKLVVSGASPMSVTSATFRDTAGLWVSGTLPTSGEVRLCDSASVHLVGAFAGGDLGSLTTAGCGAVIAPALWVEANGSLEVVAPLDLGSVRLVNQGIVALRDTTLAAGSYVQTGAGTLLLDGAAASLDPATASAQIDGAVRGTGTIDGSVTGAATIDPGDPDTAGSIGQLTFTGGWSPSDAGRLRVDLAGTTPGVEHDQLVLGDVLHANGTFEVVAAGAYVAPADETFTPVATPGVVGSFGSLLVPPTPQFLLHQSPGGYQLLTYWCGASPYCPDLQLGGPGSIIGPDISPSCPSFQPEMAAPCTQQASWAAMNGPFALYENGDPYSTRCAPGGGWGASCTTTNPSYRSSGFDYVVDVVPEDVGLPLTIMVYDVGVYPRTVSNNASGADCNADVAPFAGDPVFTSSGSFRSGFSSGNCQTGDSGTPQNFLLQLYENDGDPLARSLLTAHPSCRFQRSAVQFAGATSTYKNKWVTACTFTPTMPGEFPLRVQNSGFGVPDAGDGNNGFAMKLMSGPQLASSALRPVNDVNTWDTLPTTPTSSTYLAYVAPSLAGRTLYVDLYDPGDGNAGNYFLQVMAPPTSQAPPAPIPETGTVVPAPGLVTACRYNDAPSSTKGPATPDVATECKVQTRFAAAGNSGKYNGKWLRIAVDIDPNYTCTTNCYWTLQRTFQNAQFPTDRTVWSVTVAP